MITFEEARSHFEQARDKYRQAEKKYKTIRDREKAKRDRAFEDFKKARSIYYAKLDDILTEWKKKL